MTQYSGRIRILINQYLESRAVNNSYETLVELILADRLKSTLSSRSGATFQTMKAIRGSNQIA